MRSFLSRKRPVFSSFCNGVRTCFFYTDEGLAGEFSSTGTQIRAFGYRPGSKWSTDPLFMTQAGTWFYFQNDRAGTPQLLADASGKVVWSARYATYGKAQVTATSPVEINLRYPGQYFDAETGLHYNWHRYYNPQTGRYLTTDPIGLKGGINLYAYVSGNPLKWIDPWGLTGLEATMGAYAYATSGGGSLAGAASAGAWFAGPAAAGALGYYGTKSLIKGTYLDGGLGADLYDLIHGNTALAASNGGSNDKSNPNITPGGACPNGDDPDDDWNYGNHKKPQKWQNQMQQRGWTKDQISEAIKNGQQFKAENLVNPNNPATRYVHPVTGKSVVIDNITREILHVGGDGFLY